MPVTSTKTTPDPLRRLFAGGTLAGLSDSELIDRFLADRDETAFAALVERHGAMVLGTCLAVLRDPDDAEDAFQATFLALVRRGPSIRDHGSVGGWLHRVARRVALRANARSARRRAEEQRAGLHRASRLAGHARGLDPDLASALHEEIDRLPDRYRLPIVLCHLEGRPHAFVAGSLRWSERTLRRRLAEARDRLRGRLSRRGVEVPAIGLLPVLGRSARASLPDAWAGRAAGVAAGWLSGSVAPAGGVLALARVAIGPVGAIRGLIGLVVAVSMAAATIGLAAASAGPEAAATAGAHRAGTPAASNLAQPPHPEISSVAHEDDPDPGAEGPAVTYAGLVLDPDGRPYPGAEVFLHSFALKRPAESPVRAVSDADGRFRFDVPRSDFAEDYADRNGGELLAVADGLAPGFSWSTGEQEVTLRLGREEVPIEGRVLDPEGRPVAGATIRVMAIRMAEDGDLSAWLDDLEASGEAFEPIYRGLSLYRSDLPGVRPLPVVTTDRNGTFRMDGIGDDRLVEAIIEGPTIQSEGVLIRTRPGPTIRLPGRRRSDSEVAIHGAAFTHVARPSRPVEGVVTDLDTGAPLAGITVRGDESLVDGRFEYVSTVTDAEGRYRLTGLPDRADVRVVAVAPADLHVFGRRRELLGLPPAESLPYLRARKAVPEAPLDLSIRLDIAMKRGVWVTGRVVDRATGEPPPSAQVEYFVYLDNPDLEAYPAYRWSGHFVSFARQDGSFELVAFPGPGVLAARAGVDRYAFAVGRDSLRDQEDRDFVQTHPYILTPSNYHTVVEIDPAEGDEVVTVELKLDPGRTVVGTVLDPEGELLSGAQVAGQKGMGYWEGPLEGSEFEVVALLVGKGRSLTFRHDDRKLVGVLELEGDEPGPLEARLGPWGSASGRLVDAEGEPIVGVELSGFPVPSGRVEVDREGRFRVDGLVPGEVYRPYVIRDEAYQIGQVDEGFSVAPAEEKELGDVTMTPPSR